MSRRGRPPKPVESKRRLGNPGKRPLPDPVTIIRPVRVEDVRGDGPRSGEDLVGALMEAGAGAWIGETDALTTLRLVSDAWDERVVLRSLIAEHGYTQYVRRLDKAGHEIGGRHVGRPEVAMLRELEKQLTVWLGQLGLNPSDRGRLGLALVQTAGTRLAAIRADRARKAIRLPD